MDAHFTSEQQQQENKCADDTAFVYTGENMGLDGGERGDVRGGAHARSLPSFTHTHIYISTYIDFFIIYSETKTWALFV